MATSTARPQPTLRWAMALPNGVAMVAGDVGVVASLSPGDSTGNYPRIARFYGPKAGFMAHFELARRARIAAGQVHGGASWWPRHDVLTLLLWCAAPAVWLSSLWLSSLAVAPWVVISIFGVLLLRLTPWLWQVARVVVKHPSRRQDMHAAEHEISHRAWRHAAFIAANDGVAMPPSEPVCGATIVVIATCATAAVDLLLWSAWATTALWPVGVWLATCLTAPTVLSLVVVAVARGWQVPRWLHRGTAWARPAPSTAALRVALAAANSLQIQGLSATESEVLRRAG